VIPVGFYWTGDQVVISTATTSPHPTTGYMTSTPRMFLPSRMS
jgi:hypothetical protein